MGIKKGRLLFQEPPTRSKILFFNMLEPNTGHSLLPCKKEKSKRISKIICAVAVHIFVIPYWYAANIGLIFETVKKNLVVYSGVHLRPQLPHLGAVQVFTVGHRLVNEATRRDLHDAVGHGVEQVIIMRREDDIARKLLQTCI
jgi:hypothetical protein